MGSKQTMIDVAFDYMAAHKREVDFSKLWQYVCKTLAIPEDKQRRKKSQFYSDLMLDGRFASLEGNKWDLRNRRKYDEIHVDTEDISLDDEETDHDDADNGLDMGDDDNENNKY